MCECGFLPEASKLGNICQCAETELAHAVEVIEQCTGQLVSLSADEQFELLWNETKENTIK